MIVTRISDKLPRISQTNTVLENIGTIIQIFKRDAYENADILSALAEGRTDKFFDILESEFVNKVGSKNSSILKFFRDDPSFLEYIFTTYHPQG